MENEDTSKNMLEDIFKLLEDGPKLGKESLYEQAFNILLIMSDNSDFTQYYNTNYLQIICNYVTNNIFTSKSVVYKILVNLFVNENIILKSCHTPSMKNLISVLLGDVSSNSSVASLACWVLSNITRSENTCLLTLDLFNPIDENLQKLISMFQLLQHDDKDSRTLLGELSMLLCNLSQSAEVREELTKNENNSLLEKLVPYMSHDNEKLRKGIIGLVRNCSFDSTLHNWMLSENIDILPRLLLPLAGPEQFDDEDNDKLPIDLQYLPDTKTREPSSEIRKLLLETLNQLCTTKSGRMYLRDHNAYIILRELHKWEQDPVTLLSCNNVVDILIKTEEEIGIDDLKSVQIPSDLEKEFNKDMTL